MYTWPEQPDGSTHMTLSNRGKLSGSSRAGGAVDEAGDAPSQPKGLRQSEVDRRTSTRMMRWWRAAQRRRLTAQMRRWTTVTATSAAIAAEVTGSGDVIADMADMVGWGTFAIEHVIYGAVLGAGVLALRGERATLAARPGAHAAA